MFGKIYYYSWLKALSALSINISAAYFGIAVAGTAVSPPRSPGELRGLILYIGFGIVYLVFTVLLEKEKEGYE